MASNPNAPDKRRMTEPGPAPEGAEVGGMRSTADAGLGRALERSAESGDADPPGPGSAGGRRDAGAITAGHEKRGSTGSAGRTPPPPDDDEDEWRHEPREPVDESPLESFGKSIGETLTGSVDDPVPPKPRR